MIDWKDFYGRVWDILVEHAGAHNDEHGHNRAGFIHSMLEDDFGGCQEYRFCGHFGFGGKLRRNSNREFQLHVTCYPEDETKKRLALIEKVDRLLAELQAEVVKGPLFGPPARHEQALKG